MYQVYTWLLGCLLVRSSDGAACWRAGIAGYCAHVATGRAYTHGHGPSQDEHRRQHPSTRCTPPVKHSRGLCKHRVCERGRVCGARTSHNLVQHTRTTARPSALDGPQRRSMHARTCTMSHAFHDVSLVLAARRPPCSATLHLLRGTACEQSSAPSACRPAHWSCLALGRLGERVATMLWHGISVILRRFVVCEGDSCPREARSPTKGCRCTT